MADRYPNRPFPADGYGRGGDPHGSGGGESDPLAELARLIGQTDPFGATTDRAPNPPPQRAAGPREAYPPQPQYQPPPAQHYPPQQPQYQAPYEDEEGELPAGPPPWMQRANLQRQTAQQAPIEPSFDDQMDDQPGAVHPLHRYAAPAQQQDYRQPAYDEQSDPSRYDDALYGQLENGAQDFQREPAYPDDPYAYQEGYEEESEEPPKRRGGLVTVAAVLALAVVGTGAAFAYRSYVGSPRSGEPPIIKADNSPTKIIPPSSDSSGKAPDRMPTGDGAEKIVPREETPVDVNSQTSGPRVVFPPLNQNANPPTAASVSPSTMPGPPGAASGAAASNGVMPNSEPRKIRTFSIHGDQPDAAAAPVTAAAAPTATAAPPSVPTRPVTRQVAPARGAPQQAANAPLSLSPDAAQASLPPPEPRTRMAATTPTQIAPAAGEAAPAAEGHFLVAVSSQTSEAEAQASFRALQRKYPDQLGSHTPVIKRADLGEKGIRYRAMVGPFASREEATHFCVSYKAAGGQCFVP
ncbi:MAG TPA: SPOR domain-containing protein [Bradyrhizobium sp.]|uniref:SPOR domain-containing protein n=1 Tax=Bradyrhizobium sp. TaxID=376 RepID=UPI002B567B3F|nr:SPOR domain-containing protein [Bradyrhizobium sp.]HLZ02274.1 SPOR domain-containing protein [Bradyrhizobium sp.]